jgi:Sec-independent protein translocase protein TatA
MGDQWGYITNMGPWGYAEELQRALREYRKMMAKQQARDQEEMDADDRYDQEEDPATPAGD